MAGVHDLLEVVPPSPRLSRFALDSSESGVRVADDGGVLQVLYRQPSLRKCAVWFTVFTFLLLSGCVCLAEYCRDSVEYGCPSPADPTSSCSCTYQNPLIADSQFSQSSKIQLINYRAESSYPVICL
jgi:hypothetical protein